MNRLDLTMSHSSRKTSAAPLPDSLPGFDLEKGLIMLNGNLCLYSRLLNEFYNKYKTADEQLRNSLSSGNIVAAKLLVHNIKGLASNLAAGDLYTAAKDLEKKIQSEIENGRIANIELADFQTAIQDSMRSLSAWQKSPQREKSLQPAESLQPTESLQPAKSPQQKKGFSVRDDKLETKNPGNDHLTEEDSIDKKDNNRIESLIQSLFLKLQSANPQSIDLLPELHKTLGNTYSSQLHNLELELDRFQFDAASLILTKLQKTL
jgi:HPt (histidine-containing phosphotransfer) domain-containing protein